MAAHHSTNYMFDTSKAITLEGEITRAEWINPHVLLYLQSKNSKGENETWILELGPRGATANGLKEMLKIGTRITVRAHTPRRALLLTDQLAVWSGDSLDTSKTNIVEAGEVRLPNGDVRVLGRGPKF